MARRENAKLDMLSMRIRVGRYCLINYDKSVIERNRAAARHVYAVVKKDKDLFVRDFAHTPLDKIYKVMITDKFIPLTSAYDEMAWHTAMDDLAFIKDRSIVL